MGHSSKAISQIIAAPLRQNVLDGTIHSPALLAGATKAEAAAMIRAMKKRTRAMFTVGYRGCDATIELLEDDAVIVSSFAARAIFIFTFEKLRNADVGRFSTRFFTATVRKTYVRGWRSFGFNCHSFAIQSRMVRDPGASVLCPDKLGQ
jgi:hypothetical protein